LTTIDWLVICSCAQVCSLTPDGRSLQIWFITFYGALGFISPYFNLILQHFGYVGWQLGIVSAVRPFVSAACGPLWAAVADKYHAHRRIFLSTLFITTVVCSNCDSFLLTMRFLAKFGCEFWDHATLDLGYHDTPAVASCLTYNLPQSL
jgi:MFS family permease